MVGDSAKAHLHDHLRWVRQALVSKLDGLSEYDIRRPLTSTGTNLLGLVKHCATWDSRYFGGVFDRPYPDVARWDDDATRGTDMWANDHETRADIVELYHDVWRHADETIESLEFDTVGYVPWWNEHVPLFNVMVHCLSDTTRHAGHADILREGLDGSVGVDVETPARYGLDEVFWEARRATIERAARTAAGLPRT